MRARVFVNCALLVGFSVFWYVAPSAAQDRKALETEAKGLIAEAKALEKQGKLAEARDKYVDAEGVISTGEARGAIDRIDEQQKSQVKSLVDDAERSYEAGRFNDGVERLQQALQIQSSSWELHYDLSLSYAKLGDRSNAALNLDSAIGALPNRRERTELLEMRSTLLMGATSPDETTDPAKKLYAFNQAYLEEDRDPNDQSPSAPANGAPTPRNLCDQTKELFIAFPRNPAVVFNTAKCAEEDAKPEEAARQLAVYLEMVPGALDQPVVQDRRESLLVLAGLSGDAGQSVRQHYATAARYLDYRHYDRALAEYSLAEQALPTYALTEWQLGLFYESYGEVDKARVHLERYGQLESDAQRKNAAEAHLTVLDTRQEVYEANVDEAEEILADLLKHAMGIEDQGTKHKTKLSRRTRQHSSRRYQETAAANEKLSTPYVERELDRARQDLEAATEIFPLAPEANELLALVALQANNWPAAYRDYDAVASQNLPVSFYGEIVSSRDNRDVRATKVEIGSDSIRLIYLSDFDARKKVSKPPDKPAGEDDLGNLIVSTEQPPDEGAESLTLRAADLMGVATDKNFVVLKLQKNNIYLAPLNLVSEAPFEGGASRTFGNEYTRLFIRYLGYEDARLGKEGMTTGEKVRLGFEIAKVGMDIGMSVAMMGMGAPAAYNSVTQLARLAHAMSVFNAVGVGVSVSTKSLSVAQTFRSNMNTLERDANDDREVVEGIGFKIIPSQATKLKFRD